MVWYVDDRMDVCSHLAEGDHAPFMVAGDALEEVDPSLAVELVDEIGPVPPVAFTQTW